MDHCVQSQEGAALVDVQTTALFGNLRELQSQMQTAVGQDATSIEDLMQKVQVHNLSFPFVGGRDIHNTKQ